MTISGMAKPSPAKASNVGRSDEDSSVRVIELPDMGPENRILDTRWLLQQSYKKEYVFNILCIGEYTLLM